MLFDELSDDMVDSDDDGDSSASHHHDEPIIRTPRATATLIGHQAIEAQLLAMLQNGRFPHGLIFSGMEGIGKSVMAFRLARYLLAKDGAEDNTMDMFGDKPPVDTSLFVEETDENFSRVASGGHPDLRTIGRPFDEAKGEFKGSIPVEDIRKIAPFMRQTVSQNGGWRIVIIDDADTMTRNSQNSLLKILEEPPEKSLLILVTHRAGALLPTIYSRCQHIPFYPLSDDDIRKAITGRCQADKIPLIVKMSEGSLGAALEYTEADSEELIARTIELLNSGQKLSWTGITELAEIYGNKGHDKAHRIFCETMVWVASGLVRQRLDGFAPLIDLPLGKRIKIYDDLRAHIDRCYTGNLDKKFLFLGAFMAFEQ
jgi:DNA polymerase-3 subunit delta'